MNDFRRMMDDAGGSDDSDDDNDDDIDDDIDDDDCEW